MKLLEILDREGVLPVLAGRDKRSVLAELATATAARTSGAVGPETMLEGFQQREADRSTAIGFGVAVPHGKVKLPKVVAVLGRSPAGVDFGADDHQACHLFFALAIPDDRPGCHLAALARIARILKSDAVRRRLLDAPDADSMFAVLREEDAKP